MQSKNRARPKAARLKEKQQQQQQQQQQRAEQELRCVVKKTPCRARTPLGPGPRG